MTGTTDLVFSVSKNHASCIPTLNNIELGYSFLQWQLGFETDNRNPVEQEEVRPRNSAFEHLIWP